MEPMIWPILLLLLGLSFVVMELFIPSTGILSLLAVSSAIAAVYVAFSRGTLYGLSVLSAALLLTPVVIGLAIHFWPMTPLGRRMMLPPGRGDEDALPNDEDYRERKGLIGQVGVARSKMLPAGAVVIGGKTYGAVSRGNPIEAGATIRVVSISGNRIVVAPADASTAFRDSGADDALSQPFESLGIDPFDETAG
ncbi:MAG: hypothetical protein FJ297_15070 [Planctomycetes bacterium]|nr:hypothetical protein [Planctomycetota bacterium]